MTRIVKLAVLAGLLAGSACARQGMVDDGTTVSFGDAYAGSLHHGVQLPPRGDGYWVPRRWRQRGNQYGTDELVTMIVRVGRRLARENDAPPLGVADLSPRGGGPSPWHQSHQTGRDVDLLMYAVDAKGRSLANEAMVRFKPDGSSRSIDSHGHRRSHRYFDVVHNWALVRALLEEHTVDIQYIYVYDPLRDLLLDYAREAGEPAWLIERAAAVMEQPVDALPHDDHFHVRIFCPRGDADLGCHDDGAPPWEQQLYDQFAALLTRVRTLMFAARVALLIPPV